MSYERNLSNCVKKGSNPVEVLGPVVQGLVNANCWLGGFKTYRFPWYLMLVRAITMLRATQAWLFQASICNCLNCVHNCDDHSSLDFKSAVQYMKHFIYHFTSILHGLIITHKWPVPNVSGFIAQLVRASHRYREVTLKSWLFQASLRNCLK